MNLERFYERFSSANRMLFFSHSVHFYSDHPILKRVDLIGDGN